MLPRLAFVLQLVVLPLQRPQFDLRPDQHFLFRQQLLLDVLGRLRNFVVFLVKHVRRAFRFVDDGLQGLQRLRQRLRRCLGGIGIVPRLLRVPAGNLERLHRFVQSHLPGRYLFPQARVRGF